MNLYNTLVAMVKAPFLLGCDKKSNCKQVGFEPPGAIGCKEKIKDKMYKKQKKLKEGP